MDLGLEARLRPSLLPRLIPFDASHPLLALMMLAASLPAQLLGSLPASLPAPLHCPPRAPLSASPLHKEQLRSSFAKASGCGSGDEGWLRVRVGVRVRVRLGNTGQLRSSCALAILAPA